MSNGRYDKTKMINYFLISVLLLILGLWKLYIIKIDAVPAETMGLDSGEDVFITIAAFLGFASIFLAMALKHTCRRFKDKQRNNSQLS